jgi:hypothetical protein
VKIGRRKPEQLLPNMTKALWNGEMGEMGYWVVCKVGEKELAR